MADIVQTPANVQPGTGNKTVTAIIGTTVTAGMPVYRDSADLNKIKPARANALGTYAAVGIMLSGGSAGQYGTYAEGTGTINLGATLVVGQVYMVSAGAAGGIAPVSDLTSGNFARILGVAESASLLRMGIVGAGVARA